MAWTPSDDIYISNSADTHVNTDDSEQVGATYLGSGSWPDLSVHPVHSPPLALNLTDDISRTHLQIAHDIREQNSEAR